MDRPDRYQRLMTIAHVVALGGTCPRRSVGALLVRDGRILSTGYNGAPPGTDHCTDVGCLMENDRCLRAVHAEVNCIAQAALQGRDTRESSLITTDAPCLTCAGLLLSAGVHNVFYHRPYHDPRGLELISNGTWTARNMKQRSIESLVRQVNPIPLEELMERLANGYQGLGDSDNSDSAPVDIRRGSES